MFNTRSQYNLPFLRRRQNPAHSVRESVFPNGVDVADRLLELLRSGTIRWRASDFSARGKRSSAHRWHLKERPCNGLCVVYRTWHSIGQHMTRCRLDIFIQPGVYRTVKFNQSIYMHMCSRPTVLMLTFTADFLSLRVVITTYSATNCILQLQWHRQSQRTV